jgi:hypothetical protein
MRDPALALVGLGFAPSVLAPAPRDDGDFDDLSRDDADPRPDDGERLAGTT